MATITDAAVRSVQTGQTLKADCFGNNAAVVCLLCKSQPVLLIARPNQRGNSPENPGVCRQCGCRIYIVDEVNPGVLQTVNVQILDPR